MLFNHTSHGSSAFIEDRTRLLEVSREEAPPELAILGACVADVYPGTWVGANLGVASGRIVYLGTRQSQAVARMGGGLPWAKGGRVVWLRPFLMWRYTLEAPFSKAWEEDELGALGREAGYAHRGILYSPLVLTCTFPPQCRLTTRGVLEVEPGRLWTRPGFQGGEKQWGFFLKTWRWAKRFPPRPAR